MDIAGMRFQQPFYGAEGARLTRSIGAQQSEDLSCLYFEADTTDRLKAAIIYVEAFDLQDRVLMVSIVHGCKYRWWIRTGQPPDGNFPIISGERGGNGGEASAGLRWEDHVLP